MARPCPPSMAYQTAYLSVLTMLVWGVTGMRPMDGYEDVDRVVSRSSDAASHAHRVGNLASAALAEGGKTRTGTDFRHAVKAAFQHKMTYTGSAAVQKFCGEPKTLSLGCRMLGGDDEFVREDEVIESIGMVSSAMTCKGGSLPKINMKRILGHSLALHELQMVRVITHFEDSDGDGVIDSDDVDEDAIEEIGSNEQEEDCEDEPHFVDANHYTCIEWTDRCSWEIAQAEHYTAKQFEEVQARCKLSCGICQNSTREKWRRKWARDHGRQLDNVLSVPQKWARSMSQSKGVGLGTIIYVLGKDVVVVFDDGIRQTIPLTWLVARLTPQTLIAVRRGTNFTSAGGANENVELAEVISSSRIKGTFLRTLSDGRTWNLNEFDLNANDIITEVTALNRTKGVASMAWSGELTTSLSIPGQIVQGELPGIFTTADGAYTDTLIVLKGQPDMVVSLSDVRSNGPRVKLLSCRSICDGLMKKLGNGSFMTASQDAEEDEAAPLAVLPTGHSGHSYRASEVTEVEHGVLVTRSEENDLDVTEVESNATNASSVGISNSTTKMRLPHSFLQQGERHGSRNQEPQTKLRVLDENARWFLAGYFGAVRLHASIDKETFPDAIDGVPKEEVFEQLVQQTHMAREWVLLAMGKIASSIQRNTSFDEIMKTFLGQNDALMQNRAFATLEALYANLINVRYRFEPVSEPLRFPGIDQVIYPSLLYNNGTCDENAARAGKCSGCTPGTYAYVYPEGRRSTDGKGRRVEVLCPLFFKQPSSFTDVKGLEDPEALWEGTRVGTLLHETSHHFPSSTLDVNHKACVDNVDKTATGWRVYDPDGEVVFHARVENHSPLENQHFRECNILDADATNDVVLCAIQPKGTSEWVPINDLLDPRGRRLEIVRDKEPVEVDAGYTSTEACYGMQACTALAKASSDGALRNADNYQYLIESLVQVQYAYDHDIQSNSTSIEHARAPSSHVTNDAKHIATGSTTTPKPVIIKAEEAGDAHGGGGGATTSHHPANANIRTRHGPQRSGLPKSTDLSRQDVVDATFGVADRVLGKGEQPSATDYLSRTVDTMLGSTDHALGLADKMFGPVEHAFDSLHRLGSLSDWKNLSVEEDSDDLRDEAQESSTSAEPKQGF